MKQLLFFLTIFRAGLPTRAYSQATATKIVQNGPDADKIVIAVLGDGYASTDMDTYKNDVDRFIFDQLFQHDHVLRQNRSAFNFYRIDQDSVDSGLSEWFYKLIPGGDTDEASDWILDANVNQITNNTAYGFVANGVWAKCWHEYVVSEEDSLQRIQQALSQANVAADYTFVLLNTSRFAGCRSGNNIVVRRSAGYELIAHELGHLLVGLYDEYTRNKTFTGYLNNKNCSSELDSDAVVWAHLLMDGISLPTAWDGSWMDPDETVGMFEGCKYHNKGLYRPVHNCRMNGNTNQFCPVCKELWEDYTEHFRDKLSDFYDYTNNAGAMCRGVGTDLVTTQNAVAQNSSSFARWAVCPGRRVRQGNTISKYFFGQVFAVDRHPDQEICCRMRTRNPGGATRDGKEVCTEGHSDEFQQLLLDITKLRDPYSWSHVEVLCKLPAVYNGNRSQISTYRIGQETF